MTCVNRPPPKQLINTNNQMSKNIITQKRLKELFHYNPLTGKFTRLVATCNSVKVGDVAGNISSYGYIRIYIDGSSYQAHRLVFLYMTGKWPKDQVDHKKHIRHDNRWGSVQESNDQENHKNRSMPKTNTSNFVGVFWNKAMSKWQSQIMVNYENIHLGYFTKKADAIRARKKANIKYGFHKNHGIG